MKLLPGIRTAMRSLSTHKGRTVLMMLGVIVGVGMLTSIVALSEHTRRQVEDRFRKMVVVFDTVIVTPEAAATRGMPGAGDVAQTLKMADAEAIASEVSTVRRIAPFQNTSSEFKYGDVSLTVPVFGVMPFWMRLREEEPKMGEYFSDEDDERMNRVCVLGMSVVRQLFGDEDPVGKTIKINNVNCQVKGVLKERGAGPGGGDMDMVAFVPFATFTKRLYNMEFLTMAIAQLKNPDDKDVALAQIRQLLRNRHQIAENGLDDFNLTSPLDALNRTLAQVSSPFEKYLLIASVVALLIGGLVVMNIMTISVSERRREIGIRRSMGAKRRDIILQFLIEATAVTVVGGLIGVGLSVIGSRVLSMMSNVPPLLSWPAIGLALAASILVGVFFGIHPARKAAMLDPINALRDGA